jgi:hypothetical protein
VRIAVLVEGKTETAFRPHLHEFLQQRLGKRMPKLDFYQYDGRVPKESKLRRIVEGLLRDGKPPAEAVIALTDVYTGTNDFVDAKDAKRKMRRWVGRNDKFHPHAAQHDFEAWLLPFWTDIQALARHNKRAPSALPELVNHKKPPSKHLQEIFRIGACRRQYSKPRDAYRILQGKDLATAAAKCPELKAFLNTILALSGAEPL